MADLVEDIKARLGVYDVISQYVQLKQAGRSWKAPSPFKSEKTPSFYVSPEKNIWHCFSTGKGGDIFTFVEEYEGVDFSEALNILAEKAGLDMAEYRKSFKPGRKTEKDEMYKAHELAAMFFQEKLHTSRDGAKVLDYLKRRGLTDESIEEFKIGFAPDKFDQLYPYLMKKGISKKVMLDSGFVSSKSTNADKIYDKFRGRLMFPIFNNLGRISGFGGRALKKEQMPKYLNSPENVIYNKSQILYGLSHSKKVIKEKDQALLVEGYFDVILPYQEGIQQVVASSGTALTKEHVKLIKRFTNNVVSCFDFDEAGFNATVRSYEMLREAGIQVKTVSNMKGKDPADFVREDAEGFKTVVSEASSFLDFYIEKLVERNDISNIDGRTTVVRTMLPFLKQLSAVERDHYIRHLSKNLNIDESTLYDEVDSYALPLGHPARQVDNMSVPKNVGIKFNREEILFSIVLEYPDLFKKVSESINENDLSSEFKKVYNVLTNQYNSCRDKLERWDLATADLEGLKPRLDVLSLYGEERYSSFSQEILAEEVDKLLSQFKKNRKHLHLKEIHRKIEEAEKNEDKKLLLELLQEQQKILSKN